ncbi:hypothetical protein SAMN02746041_00330 [Desulfacinum hydrothermale DSM 13146]|uniref:Uncharacterized protein n=1 Tax=Desulfacinum hydrothermale DSM 13146 TaxID=1121390 RepID=A0A1W1X111_9BACT|nr:hypothetical protein [Desulfacinum hydrothermale]SMC17460.1 hypothetical protein SAMN02746041_00330 [Desulfacinum hydrothermale DSM 13146]
MKARQIPAFLLAAAIVWGLWTTPGAAWAEEAGFTRRDRDLLIELRTRMLEIDKRFEEQAKVFAQIDKRFDQLMDFLYILAGIFTSLVVAVIGFAYWDRRTIITQAKKETKEDLEREGRLRDVILALRQYAAKNEDLAAILRSFHLL